MAFRGRCMVELKTDLGQLPEIPVEDINSEEILKVQVLYFTDFSPLKQPQKSRSIYQAGYRCLRLF